MPTEISPCETCPVPGHCCRFLTLGYLAEHAETVEEAEREIAKFNAGPSREYNGFLPFRPLFKASDGTWRWWCPNLNLTSGRCDDYENRPYACSSYQPGTDRLCVLFEEES